MLRAESRSTPAEPATGPRTCDLIVRNGRVVTMDDARAVHVPGAVAIRDGVLVAVGPDAEVRGAYAPAATIDAAGAVVHPGLVEPHCHVSMHTSRGMLPDSPPDPAAASARAGFHHFSRWLNALEDEDEHASARLACAEMLLAGVTCFMDPGTAFAPDAVASAATAAGIRGSVADPFLWDVEGGLAMASQLDRAPASLARARDLLGSQVARNDDPRALVRGHVAVYGSGSASEELELAAKECADRAGCVLTQHQSLDAADAAFDRERLGEDPLTRFAAIGVLGPNCSFMHMNALTGAERDAVAASGMTVIWHPGNVLYYGIGDVGASAMPGLRARGVPVTVATDLAKAWTFGEMGWLAALLARAGGSHLSAEDVLAMQTRDGARAVGRADEFGSLEPGKRADLVIRREDVPAAQPAADPLRHCMFIARASSVDTVIVDGSVVVEHGRLRDVDAVDVLDAARRSAHRVRDRIEARAR